MMREKATRERKSIQIGDDDDDDATSISHYINV